MNKQDVRAEATTRIKGISREERTRQERLLTKWILRQDLPPAIGLYLSLPDEFETRPLIHALLERGHRIALPVLCDALWQFVWHKNEHDTQTGAYGIEEPSSTAPARIDDLQMILVPGRAFTSTGDRVGRGKGIYDRLLADYTGKSVGLAYREQMFEDLPIEAHDRQLNAVWVTDE